MIPNYPCYPASAANKYEAVNPTKQHMLRFQKAAESCGFHQGEARTVDNGGEALSLYNTFFGKDQREANEMGTKQGRCRSSWEERDDQQDHL